MLEKNGRLHDRFYEFFHRETAGRCFEGVQHRVSGVKTGGGVGLFELFF